VTGSWLTVATILVVTILSTLIFQSSMTRKWFFSLLLLGSREHMELDVPSGWSLRIKGL
jgi:hypothetical protein